MSNGKSIHKKLLRQESETDSSMTHPSSEIYLPSRVNSLEDWLTSLQVDSPANHTALQEPEDLLRIPETNVQTRSELFVKWLPDMSSWRTWHTLLSSSVDERTPSYGGVVVGQLTEIGYDCFWEVMGADDVGAPHRRKRWFCFGVLVNPNDTGDIPPQRRTDRDREKEDQGRQGLALSEPTGSDSQLVVTPQARDYKDTMNSQPNQQEHLMDTIRAHW